MNVAALILGIGLSVAIIYRFNNSRLGNSKFAYSFLLASFPIYYLVFAIYGDDYAVISLECLYGMIFFAIPLLSLRLSYFYSLVLLALGYVLHGIFDIFHNLLFINKGTPLWWPEFCGVIDMMLGGYLLLLALKSHAKINAKALD